MDAFERESEELLPRAQWTRRGFVMTSLATGFALSVKPVSAETITTDTTGLDAAEVKVPVADGTIPAYRAMPAQGGQFPTVLVVRRSSGCTSTSRMFAAGWQKPVITQSRQSFTHGRATRRRSAIPRSLFKRSS
jgi:hypothetical protein